ICCQFFDEYTVNGENASTAITHPQIIHHRHWINSLFETITDFDELFHSLFDMGIGMGEFQKYLSDRERAGRYFVNSRMYATLSVTVISKYITGIQEEQDGSTKGGDDDDGAPEYDDAMDDRDEVTRARALISVIHALPFYLSNADYTPELAGDANRLLKPVRHAKDDELHSALKVLHEAIELYLKVS
ncbi:hypothetical protein BYT27DRAFT_7063445, partial [Phlegmacium glaucopus]